MKIVLAGQTYCREDNGQAVFTVRLAKGLTAAGHQVLMISPSMDGRIGEVAHENFHLLQVPSLHLPYNINITYRSYRLVKEVITSFSPDIIHIQDHYFLSNSVQKISRELDIPIVGTNHFLPDNITDNMRIPERLKNISAKFLWRHMLSSYNQLLGVSVPTPTGVNILKKQSPTPPLTAISCGIDIKRFDLPSAKERTQAREVFNLTDEVTFLYVGRVDNEKGLSTLFDSFATLENKNTKLIIAGKGSLKTHLENKRAAMHMEERVVLPGFIPESQLPSLFHCADCFVMAGHAELQSIATLEAMASGLPVLAANARALPELVTHDENGLLFQPKDSASLADALEQFLTKQSQWPIWSKNSRQKACEHSIAQTIQAYVSWYEETLSRFSNQISPYLPVT